MYRHGEFNATLFWATQEVTMLVKLKIRGEHTNKTKQNCILLTDTYKPLKQQQQVIKINHSRFDRT